MALTPEDGTVVAGADSFIAVADADTYLAALGLTNWATLLTAEKEQALRRATQFMEQAFRCRWKGWRVSELQVLSWPREGVVVDNFTVASNVVPTEVQQVCAELALKSVDGDLNPDITPGVVREKVDVLEVEYDTQLTLGGTYHKATEQRLAPFLTGMASPGFAVAHVVRG